MNKLPRSDDKGSDDVQEGDGSVSIVAQISESVSAWSAREWSVLTSEGEKSELLSTVPLALPTFEEGNRGTCLDLRVSL